MTLLDNLQRLMTERGISNKHELSKQSEVPYTTIINLWERGAENVQLSTLKKFKLFFNLSYDELIGDDYNFEYEGSGKGANIATLIQTLGSGFCGVRVIRNEYKRVLYCVDVSYGNYCYTGETLYDALVKAIEHRDRKEVQEDLFKGRCNLPLNKSSIIIQNVCFV
ncbi:helix-turn-helix transcriptional regulator [Desulfitobacterium hafniense]|uniref:helix-turn-helix transcriptional regulator n=1 Tax=Desulfitobacterium hafniense TaxID=49338 RepID=UPI001AD821A9|nr:helix-turn-helix transcriptional regulator [Desulfitobacterium hafniense]